MLTLQDQTWLYCILYFSGHLDCSRHLEAEVSRLIRTYHLIRLAGPKEACLEDSPSYILILYSLFKIKSLLLTLVSDVFSCHSINLTHKSFTLIKYPTRLSFSLVRPHWRVCLAFKSASIFLLFYWFHFWIQFGLVFMFSTVSLGGTPSNHSSSWNLPREVEWTGCVIAFLMDHLKKNLAKILMRDKLNC